SLPHSYATPMTSCSPLPSPSHTAILFLHSFPTRRSSDLLLRWKERHNSNKVKQQFSALYVRQVSYALFLRQMKRLQLMKPVSIRSEEHTSELQSRFDLVCRLLLEKNKIEHSIIGSTIILD